MKKETAVITGASSGIGRELSKLFARDGYSLVLVARNREKLQQLAAELEERYKAEVEIVAADLADAAAPGNICAGLKEKGLRADVLVNNAGFNVYGLFDESAFAAQRELLEVNLIALTRLTHLLLPGMKQRGHGKILNVASTGSFSPGPWCAVYCAGKAYVLSFSEALAQELKGSGVTVTALCPGATATDFARRARMEETLLFRNLVMKAGAAAEAGYRALQAGRTVAIPGLMNNLLVFALRFLPREITARIAGYLMGPAHAR